VPKIPAGRFEEFCGKFIENSSAARSVLMDGLTDLDQDLATAALKQLVLAGERRAIFALFMHLKYSRKDHALSVDDEVVRRAVRAISLPEGRWAIELGQALVAGNPEWGDAFRRFALNASPSDRLMIEILLARQQDVGEVIHSALQDLSKLSEHQISTIADSDYWKTAPANRIVDVLEMRNSRIASGVLQQASARTRELPLLRANPLDWWLDWIEECAAAEDNDSASAYFC
jgi:Arc/MetJ family transcription regulator